jgi:hypothetical protein
MSYVGFEPTIPASEQVKTVHAVDRVATVTGFKLLQSITIMNKEENTANHDCNSRIICQTNTVELGYNVIKRT